MDRKKQRHNGTTRPDTPDGVHGRFTAAFSHWWWSHVPRSRIGQFLRTLHGRLECEALVIFADQLEYECAERRQDHEGNFLEQRVLPDGSRWEIVKNFPTEQEILSELMGIVEFVEYTEYTESQYWSVTYRTKNNR